MKYIVYCTTNLVNGKIYIGVHGTENPDIFDGYIGNSINIFESNSELKNPKVPFHKAVKKYGYNNFRRNTLRVFDNELDALDLEAWIVTPTFILQSDNYNATVGGGMPPKLNKIVYQYSLDGKFIKKWNSCVEAAISFGSKDGNPISKAANCKSISFEYLWSFEYVENLNISEYKNKLQRTPIYVYNLDKTYWRSFHSLSECMKYFDVHMSVILRAIKNGKSYDSYYFSKFKHDKYIQDPTSSKVKPHKRKILQYTLDGTFVKAYNTVREARKEFPNVSKVLSGKATHCHNFIFRYSEVDDIV